jgi:dTDP-4-amino-4,6-dideoxygalactose transaminase
VADPTRTAEVPFFDLKRQLHEIRGEIRAALDGVLDDGGYSNGPATKRFEQEFEAYTGAKHAIAASTGTSALHLALRCLDVGPGDEVVTVPMSFVATAWPILYERATPVFVDVDPERMTMDPAALERAITGKTKAIVVVHLYGQMADMTRIQAIADAHGVPVIEDCAQSVGADHRGRKSGTIGRLGCFSFYPSKNLGAYGEGGAVTTNDDALAARCRRLRDHAQRDRYLHDEVGYNYRLNSFEGAVLSVKLRHLEAWTRTRVALAAAYDRALAGASVKTPAPCPDGRHVYHLYVVRHPERDDLRAKLAEQGVHTAVHYPLPIHLQPVFRELGFREGRFPVSEDIARTCVSLPLYPEMPREHVSRVADAIRSAT